MKKIASTALSALGYMLSIASVCAQTISGPTLPALRDNGTIVSSSESIDTLNNAHVQEIANAGSTGTTLNKLAKLTGSPSTAVIATTSDTTGNVFGIVTGGAGTTGNAQIAIAGQAACVFDGAITSGHYVQVSTTAGGSCHDGGATPPTSGGEILGVIIAATNASPGSTPQAVTLFPPVGLAIGTNAEAWNANLDCMALLASNGILRRGAANTCSAGATVGLSEGGTNQTTAVAARQSSGLNVWGDAGTPHGDAGVTIGNTERFAYTNAAFTASRAWVLPAANVTGAPYAIQISDMAGGVTGTNTLVITRAGSDTVNGGTTATISVARGGYNCFSDGASQWLCLSMGAASAGGVSSLTITAAAGINLSPNPCTITTSGTCTLNGMNTNTPLTLGSGNAAALVAGATDFAGFGSICGSGGEVGCYVPVSPAMTLKNFYAVAANAPSSGQSYTLTLRTGNAGSLSDSTVTCTISNTNTTCNDTTHSVVVTAGQMVTVKMVASASATSVNGITFGLTAVTTSP